MRRGSVVVGRGLGDGVEGVGRGWMGVEGCVWSEVRGWVEWVCSGFVQSTPFLCQLQTHRKDGVLLYVWKNMLAQHTRQKHIQNRTIKVTIHHFAAVIIHIHGQHDDAREQ